MKFILTDNDSNVHTCSECGEEWILLEGSPEENNMNFCMKCGMRVTEKDDQQFIESANMALYRMLVNNEMDVCNNCVHSSAHIYEDPCRTCQIGSAFYFNGEEIEL